ncbi:beta-lactamase/transpeptidase-like protein [Podospora australis]|uniref:Beta-lactamase/transpeptidase-like protein n=1 Tax=Podospora australis TaxID=1536484 RepID=A0AAN6WJ85_9PEZI|nr:beta-lactamase/transpeptidase-like protein [Podospora australis]
MVLFSRLALLSELGATFALREHCPPFGPVLPAPTKPSVDPAVVSAVAAFKQIMGVVTSTYNYSAVAIGLKSAQDDNYLVNYTYTPPNRDPRGAQEVGLDTVFRIASASKIFPVLALLRAGISLDDSVTKYLPQLRDLNKQAREQNSIWAVDWDEITLGALASHVAGIPADLSNDATPYGNFTPYGFPPVNQSKLLNCSSMMGLPECGEDVFWDRFGERAPVQLPFSPNPVYSNAAFAILRYAFEAATNTSYNDVIQNEILTPLNMTHTFATKPDDDSLGFIPTGDQYWNYSLGYGGPSGSYYSSINDLTKFGQAILSHNVGLRPAQTRKWLKPMTGVSSAGMLIGAPWEILRTTNATKDGRLVEIYIKGGDLVTYHSIVALIPDYDLVATFLIAGPPIPGEAAGLTSLLLGSKLLETMLPAVEQASKNEAVVNYGGTYTDEATNSSVKLTIDPEDNNPGFNITSWVVRGVDVIATWPGLGLPPNPVPPTSSNIKFRLYPTTVKTDNQTAWRSVPQVDTPENIALLESQALWPDAGCVTYGQLDRATFMLQAQDHWVFTLDEEGKATGVELAGYAVKLKREAVGGGDCG